MAIVAGVEPVESARYSMLPPLRRRVGEPGSLAQKTPDFDAGVDPLLEAADELHDGLVPERDRAVGLLGGERHRGQSSLTQLSKWRRSRGGDSCQAAVPPTRLRRRASRSDMVLT